MIKKRILVSLMVCFSVSVLLAQSYLFEDIEYNVSASGTAGSGRVAPFWFTSNRYGLSTKENYSGLFRVGICRSAETDSLHFWRVGYGLDIASPIYSGSGYFCIQQAYFDLEWKMLRLSLGQKERPLEFRGLHSTSNKIDAGEIFPVLSIGNLVSGINTRPLPQVRLEMPRFWSIPGTKGFVSLKAHISFGWYTDSKWQRERNAGSGELFTTGSRYHSKAVFLKFGNEEKFPLLLSGGCEMSAQFGGMAHNLRKREDGRYYDENLNNGIKGYWHAFIPGGGDSNDGAIYSNVEGNHIGSWHARLEWKKRDWGVAAYYEHMFEDHSQLFFQYAWNDMLLGLEVTLPCNRVLNTLVWEYLNTMDQSGPVYHDHTATVPDQISARDNYYNHHIYGSWQHAGYLMGTPLLISPLYNSGTAITTLHNRVRAYHVGLSGSPVKNLSWRFLYTHEKSLGTYREPLTDPQYGNYYMLEATWTPHFVRGLSITATYGHNGGDLLGNSDGGMLTIRYTGKINSTR